MVELINLMLTVAAYWLKGIDFLPEEEVYDFEDPNKVIGYFNAGIYTDATNNITVRVYVELPEQSPAFGRIEIDTADCHDYSRHTFIVHAIVHKVEKGEWFDVSEIEGDLADYSYDTMAIIKNDVKQLACPLFINAV